MSASLPTTNRIARYLASANVYSDLGVTPAVAGDLVEQWNDQDGSALHATQVTSGSRPYLTTIGGLQAIGFPASGARLLTAPAGLALDARASAIFCVFHAAGWNVASQGLFGAPGAGFVPSLIISSGAVVAQNGAGSVIRPAGGWQVVIGNFDAALARIVSDGKYQDTGAASVGSCAGGSLGSFNGGSLQGAMREIAFFSAKMSDADIAQALQYAYDTYPGVRPWTDRTNLLVCDGDSLTAGVGCKGAAYPVQLSHLLGNAWAVYNVGITSLTLATIAGAGGSVLRRDICANAVKTRRGVVVLLAGTNDLAAGTSAAALEDLVRSYCARARSWGWQVVVCSVFDRGTLTGGQQTARAAFNAALVTNWPTYADGFADLAANAHLSDNSDATYFAADTIHLTDVGYGVVAGLVNTAVLALPAPPSVSRAGFGSRSFA